MPVSVAVPVRTGCLLSAASVGVDTNVVAVVVVAVEGEG